MPWTSSAEPRQFEEPELEPGPRRRSKLRLVVAALVLVGLGLGVAGWYAVRFLTASREGEGTSVQSLTSSVLETAWEVGTVFAESASRDVARLTEYFRRDPEAEDDADAETAAPAARVTEAPRARPTRTAASRPPLVLPSVPQVAADAPVLARPLELPPLLGVFDETDPGVIPPGTDGIRLRSLPPEALTGRLALVEVVVSPDGWVERSKLLSIPNDVHESMVVSVVKSWRFEPATKDGHPVRYRLRLPVDVVR